MYMLMDSSCILIESFSMYYTNHFVRWTTIHGEKSENFEGNRRDEVTFRPSGRSNSTLIMTKLSG